MPCRWVIHAATMELGGPTSADVIRRATASTLRRADELGARSLALVAFGTGVGGFPLDEAARIEAEEVRRHLAAGLAARAGRLRGPRRAGARRVPGRDRRGRCARASGRAVSGLASALAEAGGAGAPGAATAHLRGLLLPRCAMAAPSSR